MGNLGKRRSNLVSMEGQSASGRVSGHDQSNAIGQSSGFFSNKDDMQYNMYCINIRSSVMKRCSEMSVRRLNPNDNLLAIEHCNRLFQEYVHRRNESILSRVVNPQHLKIMRLAYYQEIPQFKYIYCNHAMIKQI